MAERLAVIEMTADRVDRAVARATNDGDVGVTDDPVKRCHGDSGEPLYSVQTRTFSGAWKPAIETCDPDWARQSAGLLEWAGAVVRIELIELPIP